MQLISLIGNFLSYKFLAGQEPVATVISSGDAETHDHPQPKVVLASAITGRKLWNADGTSLFCAMRPALNAITFHLRLDFQNYILLLELETREK